MPMPALGSSALSVRTAHLMAQASDFAYLGDRARISAKLTAAFGATPELAVFEDGRVSAFGYVARFEGFSLVAFRGTNDLHDWMRNIFLSMVLSRAPHGPGRVNVGFGSSFLALWPAMRAKLAEWSGDGAPILTTGHSLGGALAVLAGRAIRWDAGLPRLHNVYTFGQPMLADAAYARELQKRMSGLYHRFVRGEDIVTRYMMNAVSVHAGTPHHLTRSGALVVGRVPAMSTIESIPAFGALLGMAGATDHDLAAYIAGLKANLPK